MDERQVEVVQGGHEFDIALREFAGAHAHRAVHTGAMRLEEHRHDWPTLVLHLLGTYRELNETGESEIKGPAAVLHPAGAAHAEAFAPSGTEVVILRFDPAWLRLAGLTAPLDQPRCWSSGDVAASAHDLAMQWLGPPVAEQTLALQTSTFLNLAHRSTASSQPRWLEHVRVALERRSPPPTATLARELDLNCAWLARAYRAATGEGLRDTVRRRRVERAIARLRQADDAMAEVAIAVGFCDQSHMNRAVRALAGRTPAEIRAERFPPPRVHGGKA